MDRRHQLFMLFINLVIFLILLFFLYTRVEPEYFVNDDRSEEAATIILLRNNRGIF